MNFLKMNSCELIKFLKARNVSIEICDLLEGKLMFVYINILVNNQPHLL